LWHHVRTRPSGRIPASSWVEARRKDGASAIVDRKVVVEGEGDSFRGLGKVGRKRRQRVRGANGVLCGPIEGGDFGGSNHGQIGDAAVFLDDEPGETPPFSDA